MVPMGGKTENQLEMYALRWTEKDWQNNRSLGCAFIVFKPGQTLRFAWGKKRV